MITAPPPQARPRWRALALCALALLAAPILLIVFLANLRGAR